MLDLQMNSRLLTDAFRKFAYFCGSHCGPGTDSKWNIISAATAFAFIIIIVFVVLRHQIVGRVRAQIVLFCRMLIATIVEVR